MLITGASTGIGYACAKYLAQCGFQVLATVRSESDAARLESIGAQTPHGIRALQLDVTDAGSINAAAARVGDLVGDRGLCGLVNNAGICVVGPVECVSIDEWREQFEVNLFGPVAVTQALLPLLRRYVHINGHGSARVVNMSSITGRIATPVFGAYSSSKAALQSFSDALRLELQGHGIHISVLVPGTIQSEIWRKEKIGMETMDRRPGVRALYGTLLDNVSRYVFQTATKAIPAENVARVVHQCLVSSRPPVRRLIAWEAQVGWRAKTFLPERLLDFLLARTLGVPRSPDSNLMDHSLAAESA